MIFKGSFIKTDAKAAKQVRKWVLKRVQAEKEKVSNRRNVASNLPLEITYIYVNERTLSE